MNQIQQVYKVAARNTDSLLRDCGSEQPGLTSQLVNGNVAAKTFWLVAIVSGSTSWSSTPANAGGGLRICTEVQIL